MSPRQPGGPVPGAALRPFAVRHRYVVTLLAVVFVALAGLYGRSVTEHASLPGSVPAGAESARAARILTREFRAGDPDLVLLARADRPVDEQDAAAAGDLLARRVARSPVVERVRSYWQLRDPRLRSRDGRGALVLAWFREDAGRAADVVRHVAPRTTWRTGPLRVSAVGEAMVRREVSDRAAHDAHRGELLALPVTLALLLMAFGSVVAAALPVLVGVFSVAGTAAVLRALSGVTDISVYSVNICTALVLGLSIDYSLFLLSRYREERRSGVETGPALRTMLRTSGRAVFFSAATVATAMTVLLVFDDPLLRSTAYGGVTATVMALIGSLVVLPAVVALLGDRLERGDVFAGRRRRRAAAGPAGRNGPGELGAWGRIAAAVMRRPLWVGIPVTVLLLLLAAPFSGVQFAVLDHRALPPDAPAAQASEDLREHFGAGALVRATTVVLPGFALRADGDGPDRLDRYARRVSEVPGVVRVDTGTGTYRQGSLSAAPPAEADRYVSSRGVFLAVTTRGEPQGPAGVERVRRIRALAAPGPVLVGGPGARAADIQHPVARRAPLAVALAAAAVFLLVLALTRRPVLALKALLLNTLSLCATFGAIVFVFQEGHLRHIVGDFTVTGTTDVFLPILVFCIAFGLSMDYEVILLSRIVEEYRRTGDTTQAVTHGVDRTARLFTWAAVVLTAVMAALASSDLIFLKLVGVGLALAALLDATVVRGLLVPSVMALAGKANWWQPAWLESKKDRHRGDDGGPADGAPGPPPAQHGSPRPVDGGEARTAAGPSGPC
ncbi:MMPL family transporter [Streptomyces qinzhouensis]|uniref:MMPL family transporter n=1 Tax=Streptomyces qinzhouensis TaxID=2599401 RepID=A0A5B8JEZ8_9ACTN|nr:MMPL family transporter [Streptomyces qinzhouensis]QDY80036.1 MMPL family transporter [Streptomyces qinzhouensis]